MADVGVSTLGVKLGYAIDVDGTKPESFKLLTRINSIGGIELSTETIDASALEDYVEKSVAGRQSSGGTWDVTINLTDDTQKEWSDLISAADGESVWFEVTNPNLTDAFFVVAEVPKMLPLPSHDQNGLLTMTISLVINEYKGMDTKVEPTA